MKRQTFVSLIGVSRVLSLSLLVVTLGGLLSAEAAAQSVSFGAKNDLDTRDRGTSVAVGDFNGDGNLDLAVCNDNLAGSMSDSVSILPGRGSGVFGSKVDILLPAGSHPRSVAVGDFNRDGKPDLAVANRGPGSKPYGGNVSILLNASQDQSISFTRVNPDFTTGRGPFSVAVGDFDCDGKLDLATANVYGGSVSILLNTTMPGQPLSFHRSDIQTGKYPNSVAVGDFNRDGNLDLAVTHQMSKLDHSVSVLRGTPSGIFGQKSDFHTNSHPYSVAVGDFDRDGKLDLAVATRANSMVTILRNTTPMAGEPISFVPQPFRTGSNPRSVAVGDFNHDGQLDLATANFGKSGRSKTKNLSILLNITADSAQPVLFRDESPFDTGVGPLSVAVGDFNRDGKLDLATANLNNNSKTASVLLNITPICLSKFSHGPEPGTGRCTSVAVSDLNCDGKLDLAVSNDDGSVSILLGQGSGNFDMKIDILSVGSHPRSVAVGDFDCDGKPDLAVANQGAGTNPGNVSILLSRPPLPGERIAFYKSGFSAGRGPFSVAVGDFNRDGKLDLAIANRYSDDVSILMNTTMPGQSLSFAKTDIPTGMTPRSVAVGDFNRDGNLDLAVANQSSSTVSVLMGTASGPFGPKPYFPTKSGTFSIAVGDFDRDGKLDLAVATRAGGSVSILRNTTPIVGEPISFMEYPFGTLNNPVSVAAGDFNHDGKLDLATTNFGSGGQGHSLSILLNKTGDSSEDVLFEQQQPNLSTGNAPRSVAVGDFDRDGKLDVATANQNSHNVSILLRKCSEPSITATSVPRIPGKPSANSLIATIEASQVVAASNALSVTVNGGTSATVNGVTVTLNPTAPNASGQVYADVIASCDATTANFSLRVTDSAGLFNEAILPVTVTPAFSINLEHQSFAGNGGSGTVNVTASDAACGWTASTASTFITITSGSSGAGNGAVHYTVAINAGTTIRSDTITIAGDTFTVYQGINFPDVPSNDPFYDEIGKLSARGVTVGCGSGNFCPNDPVLREQMAAFIIRAIGECDPPTPESQRFGDVPPSNQFYDFIDELAELEIALGCQPGNPPLYCPSDPVKREQMSAFILRALEEFDPPTPASQRFGDVPPSNQFYNFIDRLAELQIALGCQPGNPPLFCPNSNVTRGQMAAFLVRAFTL